MVISFVIDLNFKAVTPYQLWCDAQGTEHIIQKIIQQVLMQDSWINKAVYKVFEVKFTAGNVFFSVLAVW